MVGIGIVFGTLWVCGGTEGEQEHTNTRLDSTTTTTLCMLQAGPDCTAAGEAARPPTGHATIWRGRYQAAPLVQGVERQVHGNADTHDHMQRN